MTQKNSSKIISVVHPICCGLDVHKDMVSACIIITEPDGEETFVVQEFSTFTDDLFKLKSWLLSHGCNIIAMESTSASNMGNGLLILAKRILCQRTKRKE